MNAVEGLSLAFILFSCHFSEIVALTWSILSDILLHRGGPCIVTHPGLPQTSNKMIFRHQPFLKTLQTPVSLCSVEKPGTVTGAAQPPSKHQQGAASRQKWKCLSSPFAPTPQLQSKGSNYKQNSHTSKTRLKSILAKNKRLKVQSKHDPVSSPTV